MADPLDKSINLNFRITEGERRRFKAWCATNGTTQADAFRDGFSLLRVVRDLFGELNARQREKVLQGIQSISIDVDLGLTIERRAEGLWVVSMGRSVVTRHLSREYEPMPTSRSEEFIARTRFPMNEALDIARAYQKSYKDQQS